MKTQLYKIYIMIILVAGSSCSDFLDRYPLVGPSDDTFYSNDSELTMAVIACYNGFWKSTEYGLPYLLALDHATDIGWYRMAGATLQQIGNGSYDEGSAFARYIWTDSYATIGKCNLMLESMERSQDNITPAVYNRIQLEGRFIRAYYYALLAELYGDVPLVLTTLPLSESLVSRDPKSTVIDFVLSELEAVALLLPETVSSDEKGRITRWAAYALISRVALYNEKWTQSITAAEAVMNSGRHSLHADFGELFMYDGQDSDEIILSTQYAKVVQSWQSITAFGTRIVSGNAIYIPVQSLVDSYECTDGLTIDKSPLFNPAKPFENRDPRLSHTIALPGTEYLGYSFETHRDSLECWDYSTDPPQRVPNTDATHAYASFSGYNWRKYTDPKDLAEPGRSEINFILIRYAEVLLNYAEAKIASGVIDASVLDAINEVRARAYGLQTGDSGYPKVTTTDKDQLTSIVRRERKCEFALEGHRLFDIRRWRIADEVMPGPLYGRVKDAGTSGVLTNPPVINANTTPDYSGVRNLSEMFVIEQRIFKANRDYLWPVPKVEIETNPNLTQNPNY